MLSFDLHVHRCIHMYCFSVISVKRGEKTGRCWKAEVGCTHIVLVSKRGRSG